MTEATMDMDKYVRKQAIMSGLTINLKQLYKERDDLMTSLKMLDRVIEKHESYLEILEDEDE